MFEMDFEWDEVKDLANQYKHGVSGKKFMSKQIQYTDEPMGDYKVVTDFLPSPEQLKLKSETTKITIALSKESVDFFKSVAEENDMQYQKMIRQLLDEYVSRQKANGQ